MKKLISAIFFMITHISLLHAAEPLLQGVDEIKEAISQQHPQKTILIIGVRPGEQNFDGRFAHLINDPHTFPIFADYEPAIVPLPGHFLQVKNFDHEDVLQEVSNKFPNTFDMIITDGINVTKFLTHTAKHLDRLYAALKPGGTLIFHDHLFLGFDGAGSTGITLSEEDFSHWKEILPAKLNNTFGELPNFDLPSSLAQSIDVRGSELESLVESVMRLVHDYTPQRYLATANALIKLGLKNGGGLIGRGKQAGFVGNEGGFIVKDREGIKSRLIPNLQKQQFIAEHISPMVEIATNVQKSLLQKNFNHVEVVSQDSDEETLNILRPKEHGTGIIVYKITK